MTKVIDQLTAADSYSDTYYQRYLEKENYSLLETDINSWLNHWLGFRSFSEDVTADALLGEVIRTEIQNVMANSPREQWAEDVTMSSAELLGWTALQLAHTMEHLQEREQLEGLGTVLEDLAHREGNYADIINQHGVHDGEAYVQYYDTRPGLFDFATAFFYGILEIPMESEEDNQRHEQVLEGSDADKQTETLLEEFRLPIVEDVQGGMNILIGFFNYLQTEEEAQI